MSGGTYPVHGAFRAQVMCPWHVMRGLLASWSCCNIRCLQPMLMKPMLEGPIKIHGELEALGKCPLWTSCGTGGGEGLTPLTLVEIGINLSSSGVEG